MGITIGIHPSNAKSYKTNPLNPDPQNFKIQKIETYVKGSDVVRFIYINYPNCTNFEGNKILIVRGSLHTTCYLNKDQIDPHFTEDSNIIGRIKPAEKEIQFWKNMFISNGYYLRSITS
jgi:hypothetical protein